MENSNNEQETKLWKHLDELQKKSYSPKELNKYWAYYSGDFSDKEFEKIKNSCNIIKQIIDTKSTLALDSMMSTTVVPAPASMATIETLQGMEDVADVLNDSLVSVFKDIELDGIKAQVMDDGLIFGVGIVESVWDAEKKAQGDVEAVVLDPRKIRVEKSAIDIPDSAFVFIEQEISIYEAKQRYGLNQDGSVNDEMMEKIEKLGETKTAKNEKGQASGVMSYNSDSGGGQAYAYGVDGVKNAGKIIKLYRVYLKDDSTFLEDSNDPDNEEKQTFRMQYPNGRYCVMSAMDSNKVIFEDKPIDYPFGYPLTAFNPYKQRSLFGKSEIADLMFVQDRINRAYIRVQTLVAKFVSIICYDSNQLDLGEDDFVNAFAMAIDNMRTNGIPTVLTNNTISEIAGLLEYIKQLKDEAKEIARVNDIMIAGSTPTQVKSGVAIEALMESPQASIRSIQRAFKEFLIEFSKKTLTLIQRYYNTPRIISLSEGRYAVLNIIPDDQGEQQTQVQIYNKGVVEKIVNNLQVGEYGIDIISGTEVPRSRSEQAQLMTQLVAQGMLGDINDPEMKEQYFKSIDLPNYRAIMQVIKKQQESANMNVSPPTDKITVALKDMPNWAQAQWYAKNGFEVPDEFKNMLPQEPQQEMPEEQMAQDPMAQQPMAQNIPQGA